MGFLWKFHGISGLDGFLVGHVCDVRWESSESYGISMVFLWNWWDLVDGYYGFYGICMAFRWILWWNCGGLMRIQDQLENHGDALEIMEDTSFLFTCRKRVSSFFGGDSHHQVQGIQRFKFIVPPTFGDFNSTQGLQLVKKELPRQALKPAVAPITLCK